MARGRHGGGRRSWHLRGRARVTLIASNPRTQSEICDQHSAAMESVIVSDSRHSQAFGNLVLQDKATAVRYLHDKGADQDKQDYIGFTPLLDATKEDPLSASICTSHVGFTAVNDGIMLWNHISRILRLHFRNKPYYADLLDLFNEVEFKTASGQMLDLITTHEGEKDLTKYNIGVHRRIVQFKTAYYSFYLLVACALLVSGENLDNYSAAENILVEMGTYFQVQDDYLDCYGDPEFIGKIGTDIEDYKCSWLVVQALERADESQESILFENYGKKDPACVEKVKNLYKELNLEPNNVSTNLAMAIDLCEASTKVDRYGVAQIFIDVYGFSIYLQADLSQSVKSIIDFALEKAKFRARDFYATCCGKILHSEKLLGYYAIQKDSTIKLKHRLRGGVRHHMIRCKTWDEMVHEEPRFYIANLSPSLVDPTQNLQSAKFLSQHLQYHAREVLITMCRKHKRGISYNGRFTSSQILFHDGKAFFSDEVKEESATRDLCIADYDRIYSILSGAFRDNDNTFPIHVAHLLNFLWSPPSMIQFDSDLVIAFVTNHPAIIPFDERIKICTLLDSLLERLSSQMKSRILNTLSTFLWRRIVEDIPEMKKVYFYNARYDKKGTATYVTYGMHMIWCVHFSRNFFKHAPLNLNLEEIEASFSLAMCKHNVLPKILQKFVVEINFLPSGFIEDLLKLLGNNLVGLKDA